MIKTIREWETVYFVAQKRGYKNQRIELTLNRVTGQVTLCSDNEEGVSFQGLSMDSVKLRLEALKSAVKWAEKELIEENERA